MKIKTNEKVKNEQDLQNLITSIVLRQAQSFTIISCLKTINRFLRRSPFYWEKIVEKKLYNTLDLLRYENVIDRDLYGNFRPSVLF